MPNPRSPAREIAYRLWADSGGKRPLINIASECGVSAGQIRKWKSVDKWTLDGKKKSVPDVTESEPNGNGNAEPANGNGNAKRSTRKPKGKGNPNPTPAPEGNKRAVTAGEYETILYETLSESERVLAEGSVQISPVDSLLRALAIFTVREKRILERINDRMHLAGETVNVNGGSMFVAHALNKKVQSDSGASKSQIVEYENVITFITTLEEALTRVQAAKTRVIGLLHKMQKDSVMTDLERRKVEVLERREAMEQKRFAFEYGQGGENGNAVAGWLEATRPDADAVEALYTVEDAEGEDEA